MQDPFEELALRTKRNLQKITPAASVTFSSALSTAWITGLITHIAILMLVSIEVVNDEYISVIEEPLFIAFILNKCSLKFFENNEYEFSYMNITDIL